MKKRIISLVAAFSLLFCGVAIGESINGSFNGNPIVKVLSGDKVITDEVPAQVIDGKTMVPLTMLRQMGFNVQWDQSTYSVSVTSSRGTTESDKKKLTASDIAKLSDRVGYVIAFDKQQKPISQGSGFMIKPGIFITNYHVAGNTGGLRIQLDGTQYNTYGEYLIQNQSTDTFGVYIATQHDENGKIIGGLPTKLLNYSTVLPEVGDKVYAIGSPKGLENTFSEGIVSAIRNTNGIISIQHSAFIDHGSSGGALLNDKGEVIGITSSGYEGTSLDFAVPMMYIQQELDKLRK